MAILKKAGSAYVFTGGKHPGETLDTVALKDPGYLRWARNKAGEHLEDGAFFALEETMRRFNIPLKLKREKPKK